MAGRQWVIQHPDGAAVASLRGAGYSRVLSAMLVNRGFALPAQAADFLAGRAEAPADPLRMKGMEAAAGRIRQALAGGERIVVYGDYDVDGVTSTALLLTYLRSKGADADPYIPERESEGYGLNRDALEAIRRSGASLVVTVDTGISAFEEAAAAAEMGMTLIVTDHHEPRGELPEAFAVVDPKQPGDGYPYRELAGVGVAFALACAVEGPGAGRGLFERFGALVCLGTVADVVPLTGENRTLVREGLALMERAPFPGLAALLRAAGAGGGPATAELLSFTAAPRINAAGRMGSAKDALALLLEQDETRAEELAQRLEQYNRQRQDTEAEILQQAVAMFGAKAPEDPVLMAAGEGWHNGVIGIVASRLSERYARPAVVVSFEGDVGRASCRSFPGFDIHAALMSCAPLLERFGGHELAAGFTVRRENLDALRRALNDCARAMPRLPVPRITLECELGAREVSMATARDCARLEPCGAGNPVPLFYVRQAFIRQIAPLKGGRHLRLTLEKDGVSFRAVVFGVDKTGFRFEAGDTADLAVSIGSSRYNGSEYLSVIVRDIAEPLENAAQERLFRKACAEGAFDGDLRGMVPAREDFAAVYRFLRRQAGRSVRLSRMCADIAQEHPGFGYFKMLAVLDVLRELSLIDFSCEGGSAAFSLCEGVRGRIEDSRLMRRLRMRADG